MSLEDVAQEHEAKIWLINNRRREVPHYQPGDAGYGPAQCTECEEDMPPERRAHGFTLCVPCKSATEAGGRRR